MLVGLRDGDFELLTYRLPALTRCEPAAHEVGSLAIRPDGVSGTPPCEPIKGAPYDLTCSASRSTTGWLKASKRGQAVTFKTLVPSVLLAAVVAAAVFAGAPHSANTSSWYWTPGACKSELQNNGVQIGDGRTFSVSKAFCVGLHNHCWLSQGLRRYKVFVAVVRSYDGVVRRFVLTVTGHHTWHGTKARIIEQYMTAAKFANGYGTAAWSVASAENRGGCYDIHP